MMTKTQMNPRAPAAAAPDPVVSPGPFGSAPTDWPKLVAPAFAAGPADRVRIDATLLELRAVPPILRNLLYLASELYPDRTRTDARMRLVGRLVVEPSYLDSKKLDRALADEHALNVVAVDLEKAAELKTLLARMSDSPIPALRALELGFAPTDEALEAIGAHPKLQALERLVVKATLKERFTRLASLPQLPHLRALVLAYSTDKAAKKDLDALAAAPFEQLETFALSGKDWRVKAGYLHSFLQAPWLQKLRHLQLEALEADDLDVLAAMPHLAELEVVGLRGARASEATFVRLLSSLRRCTQLDLMHARIDGVEGPLPITIAEALVASGCVPRLESCVVALSPEGQAILERAGLDTKGVAARAAADRGFWFRCY